MGIRIAASAALLLLAVGASPASAQAGPSAEPAPCEIHIWGTDNMKAHITGWSEALGGGFIGPALDGRRADSKGVKALLEETFAGSAQADALGDLPLASLLRMPSVRVIAEPRQTGAERKKRGQRRLADSNAPCYADIVVRNMYFNKTALFPPSLRANFTYRYFGARMDQPSVLAGRGGTKMKLYPLVTTQDVDSIKADFVRAFQKDFEEFLREQYKLTPGFRGP
jgi:hypothetical protein